MAKPNILLITTDEMHREALSCWGATAFETPHIDRIASRGWVFRRAYSTSPLCLPSRVSIATGLYPHNSRATSNVYGASMNHCFPNIFTELKKAGYTTSMHGKCHFAPVPYGQIKAACTQEYEHLRLYYRSLGIDRLDLQDDNAVSGWFYDDYAKELEREGLQAAYRNGVHNKGRPPECANMFIFPGPERLQPDAWVANKAVEHLRGIDRDSPHFMWLSFSGPHYPLHPPEEYLKRVDMSKDRPANRREGEWDDKSKAGWCSYHGPGGSEGSGSAKDGAQKNLDDNYWRNWRQMYYAMMVHIDDCIGRVIEEAEKKWGDNFMVIFTCDHGEMMGHHGLWGKNALHYDDIINVPLIIKWPGSSEHREVDELVSLVDLFPTFCIISGRPPVECDGDDIGAVVERGGHDYVLIETDRLASIVSGKDKLSWNRQWTAMGAYYEQYDIEKDPFEFDNIYCKPAGKAARDRLEAILADLERKEQLNSIIFFDPECGKRPPWLFDGSFEG